MKNLLRQLGFVSGLALIASFSYAAPCDNATNCNDPSSNGTGSWAASASVLSGLSANVNGNNSGSRYYFAASTTDLGPTRGKGTISTVGDGSEVIGSFATGGALTVGGGAVQQLLGNTNYFIYVQACGSSEILDSGHCSIWVQIGSKFTAIYPLSVFDHTLQKPADTKTNSIDSRTQVPIADASFISQIHYEIDDLITPARNETGININWTGNGTYTIGNADYTTGFVPNTKYQYRGQVVYPYGVAVPTAASEVVGPFWTTPVDPGAISVSQITHCSAKITALNSSGSPANPVYTTYNLCAQGTGGSCATDVVSGATPTDTAFVTITNLNPGTTYTPKAQALVGNGDGTSASWNSSGNPSGTDFTTLGFSGSFGITNITTTSADFTFSGLDLTGITAYQIIINNANFGPQVNSAPVSPIHLVGLNSNTQHSVQIKLIEASCNSTVPTTPSTAGTQFYTLPAAPTGGSFGTPTARTIPTNWTDASTNPDGSRYHLQYSATGGAPWTDFGTNPVKSGAAESTTITGLTPETTYTVRVKTVSASGDSSKDSTYLQIPGTATTPNEKPSITSLNCAAPGGGTTTTCTAQASDNASPLTLLVCHWSVDNSASLTSTNDLNADASGNCPTASFSFPGNNTYHVTLVVSDHNNTGPSVLSSDPDTVSVIVGAAANSMTAVNPLTATLVVGFSKNFEAYVKDQFGSFLSGVNWSVVPTGTASATLDPAHVTNSSFTILTAAAPGTVTLKASYPGFSDNTATITINPTGPHITSGYPTITLIDDKTANLSCLATDNTPGSTITYAWSLESGPSGASAPTYSDTDSATASSSVVTVKKAGAYVFRCTATDNYNLSDFATTTSTTVAQILTNMTVSPKDVTIKTLQGQAFTATGKDQFDDDYTLQSVAWTNTGGSLSSGSGSSINFSSPGLGQNIRVTAASVNAHGQRISDFAQVNIISYDVGNAYAYPVPYKSNRDQKITFTRLGSSAEIRVYTTTGRKVFSIKVTADTYDWNVKNTSGDNLASGVYFYVIESPEGKKDGKLIVIQ